MDVLQGQGFLCLCEQDSTLGFSAFVEGSSEGELDFQPIPEGAREVGFLTLVLTAQAETGIKHLCVFGTKFCLDFISLRPVLLSTHSYLSIHTNHISSVTTPLLVSVPVLAPFSAQSNLCFDLTPRSSELRCVSSIHRGGYCCPFPF